MKIVDARGLSCPEPIMLADEAVKAGEFPVKILVSEPHQMDNIMNFLANRGRKLTATPVGSEFEVTVE